MWFAYVENSMAWYDLDIFEVKKLISINKKGEKSPALEDLKVIENKMVTSDLIQENSVDRFEKKNRKPKSNKDRSRERGPRQNDEKGQNENRSNLPSKPQNNRPQKPQNDRNRSSEQKPAQNNNAAAKPVEHQNHNQNQNPNQKTENKNHKKPFKKAKKKMPPKNEGNA